MTLGVNGYLELYTTLLGWQQYQNLWGILLETGIAFLPFIMIIVRNTVEPALSQEPKSAAETSLKRMEFHFVGAILVVALCAQPAINLEPEALSYLPICQSQQQIATPGHTGTTYDKAFPEATGARVPILWYAVMALSHAVTRTAMLSLPCQPYNFRDLRDTLALSKIQDPLLRQETTQFYQDCYVQSLAKFERDKPNISSYTKQTGDADTQWLGSHAFSNMPGYYSGFSASTPVKGFAYDPVRDFEYGKKYHGKWGRPTCKQWWDGTDGQNGLRQRLLTAMPKPVFAFLASHKQEQDAAIKSLIGHTYSEGYQSLNNEDSGHWISKGVGEAIGLGMDDLTYYPKLALIKDALPVVQAVGFMLIYIFLAPAQVFSQYRIKTITVAACVIFSITFWSYLWQLIDYSDQVLIKSLYPTIAGIHFGVPQEDLVDKVIGALYILVPVLWTAFLSWVGVQAGNGLNALISGGTAPAMEAGNKAGSLAQQGISMLIKK